jgi:nucleotide-binding universal stress UspA family protein
MKRIQTIVVGFDGSPDANAALRWAALLASSTSAKLRIVHAVGLLEHAGLSEHAAVHSESALEVAVGSGVRRSEIEWIVVDGDPCSALLRLTEGPRPADVVVVGSRGSGAHSGTLLGSTSLELVEHSSVPVTIVPTSYGCDESASVHRADVTTIGES